MRIAREQNTASIEIDRKEVYAGNRWSRKQIKITYEITKK